MTGSSPSNKIAWLNKVTTWFTGKRDGDTASEMRDLPRPDRDIAVIGDLHGCLDLLEKILTKIQKNAPDSLLIFVGDYIDRGPSSRGVLERLRTLPSPAICLTGNHEAMLLEFLDSPIEAGGRWLRNGGAETLKSYGIALTETSSVTEVQVARESLQVQFADGTEDWLRSRPLFWRSGNVLVTHAGPDPATAIEQQDDRSFLWGHNRFLRDTRTDGIWVAHGHWIRDRATCEDGRISVDTGACFSGRLSAAIVRTNGNVHFLKT